MTKVGVRLAAACLASLCLGLLVPGGSWAEVSLVLDPVNLPDQDARVEFVFNHSTLVEPSSELARPMKDLFCKATTSFRVCVDIEEVGPAKYGGFEYPFYVTSGQGDATEVRRFLFLAIPRGRFLDHQETVGFTVEGPDGTENGSILLPLHAVRSNPYLKVSMDRPIEKVDLGGGASIWLTLSSELEDLPLLVEEVSAYPTEKRLWREVKASGEVTTGEGDDNGLPLRLQAGQGPVRLVRIVVSPMPWDALWQSLFPFPSAPGEETDDADDADGSNTQPVGIHDRILVRLAYRAEGGTVRYLHHEIPVRFVPSFPALILSVALGALVGCAIPPLIGRRRWKHWLHAVGAALLLAFCVELVALVLWNFDSRLKVLGFEVDPYQILPVVLLGVAVGIGGYRGADLLPGFRGPSADAEDGEGEAGGETDHQAQQAGTAGAQDQDDRDDQNAEDDNEGGSQ